MKSVSAKIDSISIGLPPSVNVNIKFGNSTEKKVFKDILIHSADKRFLTSSQCCSNCTKYAIESIIEYRKHLVDKLVELQTTPKSTLIDAVDYILEEIRKFLSDSEFHDINRDYRYLSEQLDELRQKILQTLYKICIDTKISYPKNLFTMINKSQSC